MSLLLSTASSECTLQTAVELGLHNSLKYYPNDIKLQFFVEGEVCDNEALWCHRDVITLKSCSPHIRKHVRLVTSSHFL